MFGEPGDGDNSLVELVAENLDLYEGLESGLKQFTVLHPYVLESSAAASTRDLKFAFARMVVHVNRSSVVWAVPGSVVSSTNENADKKTVWISDSSGVINAPNLHRGRARAMSSL